MKNLDIPLNDIVISDDVLEHLISKAPKEKGIRQITNVLKDILSKLNILRCCTLKDGTLGNLSLTFEIKNFTVPIIVTKEIIDILIKTKVDTSSKPWHIYTM